MGAHASAPAVPEHASGGWRTVLGIIGSAVLAGIGLVGLAYWLITFRWVLFASVIPVVVGAYLLFTRLTGPDHA